MPARLERTVTYFVNVILSLGYTVQVMYCQYKLYTHMVCDIQYYYGLKLKQHKYTSNILQK